MYAYLIAGTLAAGALPVVGLLAHRSMKERRRAKVSRSRRDKKISL